jgi:arylsulfatase A-like enzyme
VYPQAEAWYKPAERVTDKAVEWLRTRPSEPFFLFVHYWQPHAPYNKAPERFYRFYDGDDPCDPRLDFMPPAARDVVRRVFGRPITDPAYPIAAYDAEVAYADDAIGVLFDALEDHVGLEETLVVITADHGEIMWPPRMAVCRPWCYSHISLHEDCLRLPLIMAGSGIERGMVEENAQLVDILPTLAEWCGLNPPARLDGRSFAPALTGGTVQGREPIVVSENTYQKQRALRRGSWKYMRMEEHLTGMRARALFDLEDDPLETINLADECPDVAAELDAMLEDYIRTVTEGGPDPLHEQPISQRPWERRKAPDRAENGARRA